MLLLLKSNLNECLSLSDEFIHILCTNRSVKNVLSLNVLFFPILTDLDDLIQCKDWTTASGHHVDVTQPSVAMSKPSPPAYIKEKGQNRKKIESYLKVLSLYFLKCTNSTYIKLTISLCSWSVLH